MASISLARIFFLYLIPILAFTASEILRAQTLMAGSGPGSLVRIFNEDSAVLESQESRKDLPCGVNPIKPQLGFDMKFHAGYEISIPLRELSGSEDLLTTVFRVTPDSNKDEPVYFSHRINVPAIEADAHGDAYLQGFFDIGEGKYHIDFLIRDRSERVCSFFWDTDASLPGKEKQLALVIPPNTIAASELEPFKEEPPVERAVDTAWRRPIERQSSCEFRAAEFSFRHPAAARHERAGGHSAQYRPRAQDRQILDRCVQYAGAAGALPAEGL